MNPSDHVLDSLLEIKKKIQPVDQEVGQQVSRYIDTLTKPLGSLGRLEEIAIEVAKMTAKPFPAVTPPGVIVFAADHGIVQEGVSAFPQEVTGQMVSNFLHGGAAINVFSKQIGAILKIVDVGVAQDIVGAENKGLIKRKIRYGTGNFLKEEAMSKTEALQALQVGIEVADQIIEEGAKCLILGEMGIGNTTASSAILAVISGQELQSIVGPGTGIPTEQIQHKIKIIQEGLQKRKPNPEDPLDILSKVGGLEIAAMAGAMLSAASHRVPFIVDGFICSAAALLATQICQNVKGYMLVGHQSQEPGHQLILELLGKKPLLDLNLRLGEGTGAALSFPIVEAAINMLQQMATFSSAGVSEKEE